MSDIQFALKLTADGSGFVGNVKIAREEVEKLSAASRGVAPALDQAKGSMTGAIAAGTALGQVVTELGKSMLNWATSTVTAAAQLKDMADMTGSSVATLSHLANSFKISGAGAGTLEQALQRLSVGISGTDAESGKAAKALNLLGVEARDPAQALTEVALKLDQYADGANKAALVQAIFGRGAQQLLPALKDLAQEHESLATITAAQAQNAEELDKSWNRLSISASKVRDAILEEIVPALSRMIQEYEIARKAGLGMFDSLLLSGTNMDTVSAQIARTSGTVKDLQKRMDDIQATGFNPWFQDFTAQLVTATNKLEALKAIQYNYAMGGGRSGPSNYDARDLRANPPKPDAPTITGGSGGSKQAVDDFAKAMEHAEKAIAAAQTEMDAFFSSTGQASSALKTMNEFIASSQWEKWTTEQIAAELAALGTADAISRETKALELAAKQAGEYAKEQAKERSEFEKRSAAAKQGVDDLVASLDRETASMMLTDTERERAAALANVHAHATELESASVGGLQKALDDVNAAFDRLGASRQLKSTLDSQKAAWKAAYDDISNTITDSILQAFGDIRNAAKYLMSALQQIVSQYVLRPVVQGMIAPLAGGVTNSVMGGGMGGGSSLLSSGSSLLSGSGMLGSVFGSEAMGMFGAAAGAGFTAGLETLSIAAAAGMEAIGGLSAALGAMAAVAGPVAAVLMIGYAAYQMFSKPGGGPKSGGFASAGDISGITGVKDSGRYFTPNSSDADLQKIVAASITSYATIVKSLGGTAGTAGFALGFDTDPQGTAPNRIHASSYLNGKQVYDAALGDLGRDSAALQERLALESKRALLAAVQASDLPESISAVLNTLVASTATSDAIDNALAFAGAMKAIIDSISGNVMEDAQKAWDASQRSSIESLNAMGQNLIDLATNADGTTESMTALAQASTAYRQAVVQVLVALKSVEKQVAAMFAQTRESITTGGLSNEELYAYYRSQASSLYAQLKDAKDPESVARLSSQINDYLTKAFGLLSPEQQAAHRNEFLDSVNLLESTVTSVIERIRQAVGDSTVDPFAAVKGALDDAAGKFKAAADKSATAADKMMQAADLILSGADKIDGATIHVVVDGGGAQVGAGVSG